jgi:hypothetical protein
MMDRTIGMFYRKSKINTLLAGFSWSSFSFGTRMVKKLGPAVSLSKSKEWIGAGILRFRI